MTDSGIGDEKRRVRESVRARVRDLDDAWRSAADRAICRALLESDVVARARTVLGYSPIRGETDVGPVLAGLLERGVRVCVPRVHAGGAGMDAVAIDAWPIPPERTESVLGSVVQPGTGYAVVDPGEIDLALVPGVAFDRFGGRLGRGGGYYDRFLVRVGSGCRCWGIAWSVRVLDDRVPTETHDRTMDAIVTEDGIVRVG